VEPSVSDRQRPADAVAGLIASAAMFTSLIALAYRPLRVAPFAVLVALIAAAMSRRYERLCQLALAVSCVCFVAGTILAVLTKNSLF
jgi:hypothetical protein